MNSNYDLDPLTEIDPEKQQVLLSKQFGTLPLPLSSIFFNTIQLEYRILTE